MNQITAKDLTKQYGSGAAKVTALRSASFSVESGAFVAIMGESGSGKSTLLSIMGAMNAPSSGSFRVDDIDVYSLDSEQRADFRREFLGFIFQGFHLIPYLSVMENVMLPLTAVRMNASRRQAAAREALGAVGLSGKESRLPGEISGGEKERVAIARAIVNDPLILLADEPTGSLDTRTRREIMRLLQTLHAEGATIVMVTHSPACAEYAQRVWRITDGVLTEA
jgi:putative ABC transport system ATP-binding protein